MANGTFNTALKYMVDAFIAKLAADGETVKVALLRRRVSDSAVFAFDASTTDTPLASTILTDYEYPAGTGYATGGATLATATSSKNDTRNVGIYAGTVPTFASMAPAASGDQRITGALVYLDSSSTPVAHISLPDITPNNQDLTLSQLSGSGILEFQSTVSTDPS